MAEKSPSFQESNPALRWGVDFNRWVVPERIEVFHSHQLLGVLDSDRGVFWDSGTGVRLYLAKRWNMSVRLDAQHETRPAPGRRKTDAAAIRSRGEVLTLGGLEGNGAIPAARGVVKLEGLAEGNYDCC